MDLFALLAAFGGGVFAAAIGALPAFILTGFMAIAGGVLSMAGIAEFSVGNIAFGSFFGPHISFAAGVAAAAYAANKRGKLQSGTSITTSLFGLGDWTVLAVGGAFGVLGFLICYLYGNVLNLATDLPGMTVFTTAIIARFLFGSTGLFGKYEDKTTPRSWFPVGKELIQTLLIGAAMGIITGGIGQSMLNNGLSVEALGVFPIVCFGISAFSLIFAQTGQACATTHHMTITSATAFVLSQNVFVAVIVGMLCALLGEVIGKTFNSHCDTHIDPPAGTIFITMFILNAIF